VLGTLTALSDLGLGIALDDFGTGYSNLAYLRRYPLDALKIDRSFVQGVQDNRPLADLIVELCRLLKLTVVAEGVEDAAQLQWAAERGIAEYQGFHFSRPLPAADFETLLLQHRHAGAKR
jgi:EAL domain-containing protein (putative c-di-GMP-specific phosphodiesterase class I)